jgi:hypothetical protein
LSAAAITALCSAPASLSALFSFAKSSMHPVSDLFDAVVSDAAYPPPNDVHGITKAGLRQALLSVLAYTGYDELAAATEQNTMLLHLTLGIVLERVVPRE